MSTEHKKSNAKDENAAASKSSPKDLTCGLIMPISTLDGCGADHWEEVRQILIDAVGSIQEFKFTTRLVSEADEVGVIQKRIIQGVYNSDIVICDVSGKNSNVMFELGMRLAFDKPTVIIKDDKTDYSFDTGVIEHLNYPRDLRFARMVDFKGRLAAKVSSTYKAAASDASHSPFLKSFGQFQVASLTQTEVSPDKLLLEVVSDLQREFRMWRMREREVSRNDRVSRVDPDSLWVRQVTEICQQLAIDPAEASTNMSIVQAISDRTSLTPSAVLHVLRTPAFRLEADKATS